MLKDTVWIALAFFVLLFGAATCNATPEVEYSENECLILEGQSEYILPDYTRIDCLTEEYAIEHDFAHKWYECITQAMYYGMWTRKTPVCSLIIERDQEIRYFERAERLIEFYDLPVELWVTEEVGSYE